MNEDLIASSPLAWVVLNKLKTENQKPLEFHDHRFLIDLYADMHDDIVVRKSAQVGESVERIFKSIWCAKYLKANIIYVLPTKNVVDEFVAPKVNPIINSNPAVKALIKSDSRSLKQIGDRFIYYSGAFSESAAIMKSADILILDELDRMKDMSIVGMFDSRLQASTMGWRWRLSNPSQVGFGVDQLYNDSDQRHWFITCSHCGHYSFIDFTSEIYQVKDKDLHSHYVEQKLEIYACGECHKEIYDDDRRNGKWVARYPSKHRHGYWISQMMAPWVSAKRIMEQKNESPIDFFYNFVLGKAYTPTDLIVDRLAILRATAPSDIVKKEVVIGVDQNVSEQIWVAGTQHGIFAHGKTHSWEELETLKLTWDALVVADPAPYPTMPKILADKYRDFYLCYFKEMRDQSMLQWKGQIVYADRTRLLDVVAKEITEARPPMLFREAPHQLEDYIADWSNLYRTTEEKDDGRMKSIWKKKENKESDFSFATAYYRIGLSRLVGGGAEFIEPAGVSSTPITEVSNNGQLTTTLQQSIEDTFNKM